MDCGEGDGDGDGDGGGDLKVPMTSGISAPNMSALYNLMPWSSFTNCISQRGQRDGEMGGDGDGDGDGDDDGDGDRVEIKPSNRAFAFGSRVLEYHSRPY